jgi:hypothetical protein
MQIQTVFLILSLAGAIMSAAGAFGYAHFSRISSAADKLDLQLKLDKFEAALNKNTEQIFRAMKIKVDVWTPIEVNSVPPGVTDYLLLLFRSDRGRISGKVRVVGSQNEAWFSTTVNDTIPVSVANLWMAAEKSYKSPTVIEFTIVERTDEAATLTILTAGWVDSRGREPH